MSATLPIVCLLCRNQISRRFARWRDDAGSSQVVLAARQPTTKLPSGSLVRRGSRKARLDVDANDMNQEAARRSWDAAEALCAVADAASPES
jgi:hypothetical protein